MVLWIAGLLVACTPAEEAEEPQGVSEEANLSEGNDDAKAMTPEVKEVDQFEIAFSKATKLKDGDDELAQLAFFIRNTSADEAFFDSFFLTATNSTGEELPLAPKENFAAALEPGEEAEGKMYVVLKGDAPITVKYDHPDTDAEAEWEIGEIE